MFFLVLARSALTKELPMTPTPADSSRPRAKITSTCGHAADAEGMRLLAGTIDGPTSRPAANRMAVNAARRITTPMLADELTRPFHAEC
jgi:hypothetical protein